MCNVTNSETLARHRRWLLLFIINHETGAKMVRLTILWIYSKRSKIPLVLLLRMSIKCLPRANESRISPSWCVIMMMTLLLMGGFRLSISAAVLHSEDAGRVRCVFKCIIRFNYFFKIQAPDHCNWLTFEWTKIMACNANTIQGVMNSVTRNYFHNYYHFEDSVGIWHCEGFSSTQR